MMGQSNVAGFVLVCLLLAQAVLGDDARNHTRKLLGVQASSRWFLASTTAAAAGDAVTNEWQFDHGRALLAIDESSFRPLAPRDDRPDPFDNFKHYRKGYDVKSKHYWGSVAFTGISGYAIAAAWLALGLLLLLFLCCKACFYMKKPRSKKPRSKNPRSRGYHWAACVVVVLLAAIAVGCSVLLFVACKKFTAQANNVEDVLVEAAHDATDNIDHVSDTLAHVKDIVLSYSPELYRSLNTTETKLNNLAAEVNEKLSVYKKTYRRVFRIIEIVFLVVASLNLLLIVLGFVLTFLKWRRFFYLIIVITWIFVAVNWVMYGFFFSVHHLADDTCLAFKQYLQSPQNTTLDDLFPCADLDSSSTQYFQLRRSMKSVLATATTLFLFYTNGVTSLTGVCDPIGPAPDYKYTGVCANDTLPIGELPDLVKPFVCNDTRAACLRIFPFYVNQTTFNDISALTRAAQSTLDAFPQMEALTNCSFVTNPVNTLVTERCGPAKVAVERIWIAFAVVSSIMTLLLLSWGLAKRRHDRERYNITSVTPQDAQPPAQDASAVAGK